MTKSMRLVLCSAVTLTLAMPALAEAQARPRGDDSSGSAGSSNSGGGSSDSGGSGARSSPEPSPSRAVPSEAPRTGFAAPRGESSPPPMPSGDRARPVERDPGSSGGNSGTIGVAGARTGTNDTGNSRVSPERFRLDDPSARPREGRPTTGFATRRSSPLPSGGDVGPGSWSDYYPWYGSGLNWYYTPYGAYPYNANRWIWGRYGMWHDPTDPFGYYGSGNYRPEYGYMPGYGYGGVSVNGYGYGGSSLSSTEAPARAATGSVRVRVSPRQGKVYVDGTLMGTVDEFDGLKNHLATTAGSHEIEIRADGYRPLTLPVSVDEDKTVTIRGSLKKN